MNGVNCFECCNSFLRFVTCGRLGSSGVVSGIPQDPVRLVAITTVSQGYDGPFPPLGAPVPDIDLTDRFVVQLPPATRR